MRLLIFGIGGKMGQTVYKTASEDKDIKIVAGIDQYPVELPIPIFKNLSDCNVDCDVVIDFSRPDSLNDLLTYALHHKTALVLSTTGYTDLHLQQILKAGQVIPIFQSSNMSFGVNLMVDLCRQAARNLPDSNIEIIEQHHNAKIDAPSGTAVTIAKEINKVLSDKLTYVYGRNPDCGERQSNELGIHSIRGGTIVGKHEVMFILENETITITHNAESKTIFASGSLHAAKFIATKGAGLYGMKDLIINN